jgi:hypothetical protein
MNDDRDVRESFAALRREDDAASPAFDPMWDRAARRHASRRSARASRQALWAAAGVACLAGATILYRAASPPPETVSDDVARAFAEWRAPTDFLLRTPGRELLETVPRIGVDLPSGPTDGMPPKHSRVTPSPRRR